MTKPRSVIAVLGCNSRPLVAALNLAGPTPAREAPAVPSLQFYACSCLSQPTFPSQQKNPDSLIGFGVVIVAVGPNPARPYSLPVASVSNESVSRERRFMVVINLSSTPLTLAPATGTVKVDGGANSSVPGQRRWQMVHSRHVVSAPLHLYP